MSWRDLLQSDNERVTAPWIGGRTLHSRERTWKIEGRLPPEHGWYVFRVAGRKVQVVEPTTCDASLLQDQVAGYLVGDRLVRNNARVVPEIDELVQVTERVHLIDAGLDRFTPIVAGRPYDDGPLIFERQDFPLGAEGAVLQAFLDSKDSVDDIPGVVPALDAAFRIEVWQRREADRIRREEQERREREERRRQLHESLGSGVMRREMAQVDFASAARAALAVGGAEYLDHVLSVNPREAAVKFRFINRRFECVCNMDTLRIIDAGICLTDSLTGVRGDTRFTLESLPTVIAEADRDDVLVVTRHV